MSETERKVPEGGGKELPEDGGKTPEDGRQELEDGVFPVFQTTGEGRQPKGSSKSGGGQAPSTGRTAGRVVWGAAQRGTREESSFLG